MRKELIIKVNEFMQQSGLHKDGAIYPRRYFDDLIMEHHMSALQSKAEAQVLSSSVNDASRLRDLLSPRLPFGLPSGKQTISNPYVAKNSFALHANSSIINAKISSPRMSQEETQMNSQLMPVIKGASRFTNQKMMGV